MQKLFRLDIRCYFEAILFTMADVLLSYFVSRFLKSMAGASQKQNAVF